MAKKSFHDLVAFQQAVDLAELVYEVTEAFPSHERYGLTSQMRRAAIRVGSDIGEGQGRLSYGEWRQMLSDARGSLFEVDAQRVIARRLQFLDEPSEDRLREALRKCGAALNGLIRWVRAKERAAKQPSNSASEQPSC